MVASAAAVTFEWRASDGWPGVLTLTASLGTVIPAAGRSGQADTSNKWCAFIGSPRTHGGRIDTPDRARIHREWYRGGSSTRCHNRDLVQFWCGLLSIRFRLLLLATGQVESFNGRLGDASLNAHRFMALMEARHHNDRWPGLYNQERPQSSLVDLKAHRNWPTLARTKAHRHGVNASRRPARCERVGNRMVSPSKTNRS